MRRAEAQYLRFLRTKERAENFTTIKIIGKGAFGEVKLVQRKNDGKIYALKSLVKAEMVRATVLHLPPWLQLTSRSSRKTSSPTSAPKEIFLPSPTARGSSSCTQRSKTTPSSTCSWSSFLVEIS
jgi:hypothetical protein